MKPEVPLKEKLSLYWLARHKPYWLVIGSGLMLGLSFPPFPFFFLIFFAFVPLFFLMQAVPKRVPEDKVMLPFKKMVLPVWRIAVSPLLILAGWKRFRAELAKAKSEKLTWFRGYLRFIGYNREYISGNAQLFRYTYITFLIWNGIGCYWLILTHAGGDSFAQFLTYLIAGVLAVVLNPILMALPFQLFSRIRHEYPPVLAAALGGVFWLTFESLHFNWEASWPWLTLGHALSDVPGLIQFIEFTGVLGLTVYIWGANVFIYYALKGIREKKYILRSGIAVLWIALPMLLCPLILQKDRAVFQPSGSINVRIVQPNIDPFRIKFEGTTFTQQIEGFAQQIESEPLDSIDLVLLPETAIPRPIYTARTISDPLLKPLWEVTTYNQVSLLMGIRERAQYNELEDSIPPNAWLDFIQTAAPGEGPDTLKLWAEEFNAALMIRDSMTFHTDQKAKLIPMVERTPWLKELGFLSAIGVEFSGKSANLGFPDSLNLLPLQDSTQVGVLICYESAFGELARKETQAGAELLTILTNDGWWGNTSGHLQHAHLATLRAIENRRAVARCANTGISLFADVQGNLSQQTPYWETAIIDQTVNLYSAQTFYVKHGNFLGKFAFWISLGILLISFGLNAYKRFKPQSSSESTTTPDS